MSGVLRRRGGAACLWIVAAAGPALADAPQVDGVVNDWSGVGALPAPAGGDSGVFSVSSVSARSTGTVLFLRFDTGIVKNLQSGDGAEGTLLLDIRRTQPV
jgi:hypothetical protein